MSNALSHRTSALTRILSEGVIRIRIGWNWKTYILYEPVENGILVPDRTEGHVRSVVVTGNIATEVEIDGRRYSVRTNANSKQE